MKGARDGLMAALDIGSSKIACFIARRDGSGRPQVLGIGHRMCRGVRGGVVIDIAETERAIRAAVEQAEKVAGETVEDVLVSVSGGRPASRILEAEIALGRQRVEQRDILQALTEAQASASDTDERHLLHAFPACYSLDGALTAKAPVGLYGERLGLSLHLISVDAAPLRNLEAAVGGAHLAVDRFILAPYASGLAVLVDDERELGAAVVDLGAGQTQIGVFLAGALIHSDCIPVGAQHVTSDIARGLMTPVEHAERLKTLYGAAIASAREDREEIDVPSLGEAEADRDAATRLPRAMLTSIIEPRVRETFELVRARLEDADFDGGLVRRIVLTGGGAQLPGIVEIARDVLGHAVRLGRPQRLPGLADATSGPPFATAAGMLIFDDLAAPEAEPRTERQSLPLGEGRLKRVGRWFRENF